MMKDLISEHMERLYSGSAKGWLLLPGLNGKIVFKMSTYVGSDGVPEGEIKMLEFLFEECYDPAIGKYTNWSVRAEQITKDLKRTHELLKKMRDL